MPHSIVPGCTNYRQRSDCSISFDRISSNQQMKKKWLARIPRAVILVRHGQKERRRLRAGSIPSVFPQRTGGATSEPSLASRMQSENRKDRRERGRKSNY